MSCDSSDETSDEFSFSYRNTAKRAFETVKRKLAKVETLVPSAVVLDLTSEPNGQYEQGVLNTAKDNSKRRTLKLRRGRSKRRKSWDSEVSDESSHQLKHRKSGSSVGSVAIEHEQEAASTSAEITCQPKGDLGTYDSRDSDLETESESAKSEDVVSAIESSDVEPLSPETTASAFAEEKDENELISVKVSWKFQPIQKFQLRKHQKFKELIEHFSKLEGVPVEQVVIYGGRNNWRLIEPYDTPDTIGITVTDILEGGVLISGDRKRSCISKRFRDPSQGNGEEIEVRVQQEMGRSFPVLVNRRQKMKVLITKVAEQLEVDVNLVKLLLNGEIICSSMTAEELDLEDGDVLDMI